MALPTSTAGGQWTIQTGPEIAIGVNPYGAWRVGNLDELWQEADQRGTDRILPGTAGVKAYRRRRTVTTRVLDLQIVGHVNGQTGAAATNTLATLEANWLYLMGLFAPRTGDGTVTSKLTLPSGATKTKPIHIVACDITDSSKHHILADLEISIPAGSYLA